MFVILVFLMMNTSNANNVLRHKNIKAIIISLHIINGHITCIATAEREQIMHNYAAKNTPNLVSKNQ